ncbi:hypothetical protein BVG79_01723 [Ketogulonicigenium robustum]|uniref:Uncharacterized protein n=1 Tax=Ketogulonicigenium robustum TaxID=92947 RepID=A0A1W6P1A5_9RHOB|nr:hypothetical protein [Ketogulonicigenium robustum]ARO15067.1 hypothetical protein BVG79_01723 [Ketogulonicigenium robustum]
MIQDSDDRPLLSGEQRIAAAVGRVNAALTRMAQLMDRAPAPAYPADTPEIEAALYDAESRVARLEAHLAAERERLAVVEQQLAAQGGRLAEIDDELYRLRQSNAELRAITEELRASLSANVADPALVNRAMEAEIAALQANRAADLAEVSAVIAGLRPLVANAGRSAPRQLDAEEEN